MNYLSRKKLLLVFSCLITLVLFATSIPQAHASLIDNLVNSVKHLVSPTKTKSDGKLTLTSKISKNSDGSDDKSKDIHAGDTVIFSYLIRNDSDQDYKFTTVNTNVSKKTLNFIHNIQGAYSLDEQDGYIIVPNLYIHAHQVINISFEASINTFTDQDKKIATHAEILDSNKNKISESLPVEINAKAITQEQENAFIRSGNGRKKE